MTNKNPFTQEQISLRTSDAVCFDCGKHFLTKKQKDSGGNAVTFNTGTCGLCNQEKSVTHIRNYNWLQLNNGNT